MPEQQVILVQVHQLGLAVRALHALLHLSFRVDRADLNHVPEHCVDDPLLRFAQLQVPTSLHQHALEHA